MNYYPNYNQYYGQGMQQQLQQVPKMPPVEQQYPQYVQPQPVYKQIGLQGKSVDSIEVVKAMEIPLDGSVSYFPITDGTAIVTKQLQPDGSSKTIVYKPVDEEEPKELPKYVTEEDLDEKIKTLSNNDLKEDFKILKRKVEDLADDVSTISKDIKKRKD